MGKMIRSVLIFSLMVTSLGVLALVGYGLATGRLAEQQRSQYLATWKGQTLVPPPVEEAGPKELESPQEASLRIQTLQLQREVLSREMEMRVQLLRDRENAIAAAQNKLDKDLEWLQVKEHEFESRLKEQNEQAREESFLKAVKSYSSMKAKYVKDDFMNRDDADVVRYLSMMKTDVATKILEQFKTPEEQARRGRLMELLEEAGTIQLGTEDQPQKGSGELARGL